MAKNRGGRPAAKRESLGDPADRRSWESLLAAFFEWRAVRHYAESGRKGFESNLRFFGSFCVERGLLSPLEVTRDVIERYQRTLFYSRRLNDRPLSVRTQILRLTGIRVFFRWLAKERYLASDPAALLELPKSPVRLPVDSFSRDELEVIFAAPDVRTGHGLRSRAILELLYSTGLRRAELVALAVYDVDFSRGVVTVRQGKGGKDRVVPIGERALSWLRKYLEDVRADLVVDPRETALFVTEAGERLSKDAVGRMVAKILETTGLRARVGACHLFRHTMATQMLSNGADIRFIQEMLGHAQLNTTQVYTRVSIEKLKAIHAATHPAAQLRSSGPESPSLPAEADESLERLELEASGDPDELARPERLRSWRDQGKRH